jgi:hypothetical protein
MTRLAKGYLDTDAEAGTASSILGDIKAAIELCRAALPDAAVEREIRELEALQSVVRDRWPLDGELKSKIDIGAFAAKNIADWNPELADSLMRLEYKVRRQSFLATPYQAVETADVAQT